LSILAPNSSKNQGIVPDIFIKVWNVIFNYDFLILFLTLAVVSLVPTTFIYLAERRKKDGFLDTDNFFYGIFLTYFWCLTGILGQGDGHPKTKTGKFFGLTWIILGVLFIAMFTSQITADLTSDKLSGTIHSIADLQDKKVATLKGTTSSTYLSEHKIEFTEYDNLKEAAASVTDGKNEAVVYDLPALEYFASTTGNNKFSVVGGAFTNEDYGIVLPTNSPLRKPINEALLKLYQSGEYDTIKAKWFGMKN
jgi:polar amino acid transport system substrate-binding protein